MGERLTYRYTFHTKTDNGYLGEKRYYEAENCIGCPLRERCTKAMGYCRVNLGFQLKAWRQKACQNLTSEEANKLRSLRGVEVENVFGRLQMDWTSADSSCGDWKGKNGVWSALDSLKYGKAGS